MDKITPNLWFDTEAVEAAELYASVLPDSRVTDVTTLPDTPSGDAPVVSFELCGQPFMAISAGPLFTFTPAVSFLVRCRSEDEAEQLRQRLLVGGGEDRYGLSWRIVVGDEPQRIVPTLTFAGGRAREAVEFYTSVFPDSSAGPGASFTLAGYELAAVDGDAGDFNEAISLMIGCETQEEIDYYWERLSAVPEAEQCGWLKDRFGVSWQVTPVALGELLASGSPEQVARVTQALLPLKKLDLAVLQAAYAGAEAPVGEPSS